MWRCCGGSDLSRQRSALLRDRRTNGRCGGSVGGDDDGGDVGAPALTSAILAHAATYHRDAEIVSRTVERPIHRYTYAEAERRSKRLARALLRLGIKPGH